MRIRQSAAYAGFFVLAFLLSLGAGYLVADWRTSIGTPDTDTQTSADAAPPPTYPPAPTATVVDRVANLPPEQAIDAAFAAAFSGQSDLATSLGGIERGDELASVVQAYRVRSEPILASISPEIRSVVVASDGVSATLEYRLLLEDSEMKRWAQARAVRLGDMWYVAQSTACDAVGVFDIECSAG